MSNGELKQPISYDPICVLIATSKKRTNLLLERSLKSVYEQKFVNPLKIVIVDDNTIRDGESHSNEYKEIKNSINLLRKEILKPKFVRNENLSHRIFEAFFPTILLTNNRTKGNSGTGAWNTAIYHLYTNLPNPLVYIAILDDDDEYKPNHLFNCFKSIRNRTNIVAVFSPIIWKSKGTETPHIIDRNKITQKEFFIGNPGIQGSNMFIRLDVLKNIDAFDEHFPSTTDRDLMIRFLDYLEDNNAKDEKKLSFEVLRDPSVIHHAYGLNRVTDDKEKKHLGLELFYQKYKDRYSKHDLELSLQRAKRLFGYNLE